jgi:hypothetical protein
VSAPAWKFAALWNAPDPRLDRQAPKGRTNARWTMKDGTKIRVVDMSDAHLLRVIELMKRASERMRLAEVLCIGEYIRDRDGTMAADAAEEAASQLSDSDDPADYFPIYNKLIADAEYRGLAVDASAFTIYARQPNPRSMT